MRYEEIFNWRSNVFFLGIRLLRICYFYAHILGGAIELLIGPIGNSSVLQNVIDFFKILFEYGFVGLITAIWTPGQFYISYLISNFLKKYYY